MSGSAKKSRFRTFGALSVAAGILFSRLSGLARSRVFAHFLGNSDAAGAFNAALRIPNFLQNLFGEGVLSASFIPVYAQLLAQDKREEASHVAGAVLSFLFLTMGALTLIGVTFSHELIDILAPGFTGESRALTETLVKIMFPGTGLLVLSAWCLGVLNSHRQFFLSYVAPVFWNLTMIIVLASFGAALMGDEVGRAELVKHVAWATVVGAGLQLGVQLPFSIRANHGLRLSLDSTSSPVKTIFRSFLPAVMTRGVVQISAYIDQLLASYLGPQSVAAMAYAQTVYSLPVSLFGISVTAAELPEMSKVIGNELEIATILRGRLAVSVGKLAFFMIPSAIAFWALGDVIVATLFQTGHFQQDDARFVWMILAGSSVGILASTQGRLCVSVFWALRDTRTPMRYATMRVILTGLLGYIAVFPLREAFGWHASYSAAALTASAGASGWIEFFLIRRALELRLGKIAMWSQDIARSWVAGLIAAATSFGLKLQVIAMQPILRGIIVLGCYLVIYGSLTYALNVTTSRQTLQKIAKRLRLSK